jgi:ankyrin repeat protein
MQEAIDCTGGWSRSASCLHRAEIVRLLLRYGSDPNGRWCPFESRLSDGGFPCTSATGVTPLMMAAARDQADTTYLLLDAGADLKLEDTAGGNALDYAWGEAVFQLLLPALFPDLATREAEALSYLTECGARKPGPWNQTALGSAILGSDFPSPEPPPPPPPSGWKRSSKTTPSRRSLSIRAQRIGRLLDIGADPDQRTSPSIDWTPVALAISAGDPEALEVLLVRGADPNTRWCAPVSIPWDGSKRIHGCEQERGMTPLMWAARWGAAQTR